MGASSFGDVELSAWLDGEAPIERREAIERWLRTAPEAAARLDLWRRQNDVVRARFARIAADAIPDRLWPTASEARRREPVWPGPSPGLLQPPILAPDRGAGRSRWRGGLATLAAGSFLAGAAAALIGAAAVSYAPAMLTGLRVIAARPVEAAAIEDPMRGLLERAIDAHRTFVRDVRPVEIPPEDLPRLKRFLTRRIGFSVAPPVFDNDEPRLLGGRITPGDAGPDGLLVYEDAQGERYGLVIGRIAAADAPLRVAERGDGAVATWSAHGAGFALSGPGDPARLRRLAMAAMLRDPAPNGGER